MTLVEAKDSLKTALEKTELLGKDNIHMGLVTIIDDAVRGGISPPVISIRTVRTSDYDMIYKPRSNRMLSFVVEYVLAGGSEYPVGVKLEKLADAEYDKFEQSIYYWTAINYGNVNSIRCEDYADDSSSVVYTVFVADLSYNANLVVSDAISGRPLDDFEGIQKTETKIKEDS